MQLGVTAVTTGLWHISKGIWFAPFLNDIICRLLEPHDQQFHEQVCRAMLAAGNINRQ